MSIVKTPTDVDTLKNYLTQEMYEEALANDEINENELYLTLSDSSGGNTNSVELTQAEYDALTTEEKNNGTIYFITDGTPSNLIVNDSVPIGAIQAYGGVTAPAGWLMCDGSAVSRSAYSELYVAIGTTFGGGDGSTTFNLPDLRGRTAIGSGIGTAFDATERTIGQTGGSESVTLTVNQIPSHTHTTGISGSVAGNYNSGGSSAQVSFDQTVGVNTASTGGDQAHNNMQPYIATNYIIKAKDHSLLQANLLPMLDFFYPVGSYYETSDSSFDPNVSMGGEWVLETEGQVHVSAETNYVVGQTGGEETHTLTISEMPSHSHTFGLKSNANVPQGTYYGVKLYDDSSSTSTAGGDQAHNNMQPYIVVNRWHRVA